MTETSTYPLDLSDDTDPDEECICGDAWKYHDQDAATGHGCLVIGCDCKDYS